MGTPLHVLILEDRQADAELILYELRRAGFEPLWQRVENEADYLAALSTNLDLILADYSLPQFGAPHALELLHQHELDIPFIIVSGTIGEDVAVNAMRQGATDYLIKDRLGRLGLAVTQALQQRQLRIDKRRTDQRLEESERRFRALIEHSSDGIALIDANGKVRYTGPSAGRILGYNGEEITGQNSLELVHPDDVQTVRLYLKLVVEQPGRVLTLQSRMRHRDGSWRWIESIISNLFHEPSVQALCINYRDITERKLLEAQYLQAQKMEGVGRLAGGVAHDFNNLLTAIKGYVELNLLDLPPDTPLSNDLQEIAKIVERASALTRQLLTFARKQVIAPQLLNINDLITDMGNLLRRLLDTYIDLTISLDPHVGLVKADPGQLNQVLVNMTINARDAMPDGGTLAIETRTVVLDETDVQRFAIAPGRYSVVTMRDSGVGIDLETQQHIFEPFFTTKGPEQGTGLGLATCYGIIKQHGGHIMLHSQPGEGATFYIYLPQVAISMVDGFQQNAVGEGLKGTSTDGNSPVNLLATGL